MALKSTELRIGNVIFDHKGEIKTVTAFDLINLECLEKNLHHDPRCKDWRGIPLDEGWLQKFGFAFRLENGKRIQAFIGDNPVTHDWLFDIKIVYDYWFYRNGHHRIDYVHQLQNLYHSLTGNELEIKD